MRHDSCGSKSININIGGEGETIPKGSPDQVLGWDENGNPTPVSKPAGLEEDLQAERVRQIQDPERSSDINVTLPDGYGDADYNNALYRMVKHRPLVGLYSSALRRVAYLPSEPYRHNPIQRVPVALQLDGQVEVLNNNPATEKQVGERQSVYARFYREDHPYEAGPRINRSGPYGFFSTQTPFSIMRADGAEHDPLPGIERKAGEFDMDAARGDAALYIILVARARPAHSDPTKEGPEISGPSYRICLAEGRVYRGYCTEGRTPEEAKARAKEVIGEFTPLTAQDMWTKVAVIQYGSNLGLHIGEQQYGWETGEELKAPRRFLGGVATATLDEAGPVKESANEAMVALFSVELVDMAGAQTKNPSGFFGYVGAPEGVDILVADLNEPA